MERLNTHTGDRSKPVETEVSVRIGDGTFRFFVYSSRESASQLKPEHWNRAKEQLQEHVDAKRIRMAYSGDLFLSNADEVLREDAQRVMKQLIYEQLRQAQRKAGCHEWQVDSLLAGEQYAV